MIIVNCVDCGLVAQLDQNAKNKCPTCQKNNCEQLSGNIEPDVFANTLLDYLNKNTHPDDVKQLIKRAESNSRYA